MTTTTIIPPGFRVHTENGAKLLLPEANQVFLNPVQEFNRDLSVAAIRVWSEQLNEIKRQKWENKQKIGTQKREDSKHKRPKGMCSGNSHATKRIKTFRHAQVENQIGKPEQENEDIKDSDEVTLREVCV